MFFMNILQLRYSRILELIFSDIDICPMNMNENDFWGLVQKKDSGLSAV